MSKRKPLVVAIKASAEGAVRSFRELAQAVTGVGRSAAGAEEAQKQFGESAEKSAKEATAALRKLNVKSEAVADSQIASIEKNKAALKSMRKEGKLTADEYARAMKSAERKVAAVHASIERDARTTWQKVGEHAKKGGRTLGGVATGVAAGGAAAGATAVAVGGELTTRGTEIKRASIVSGESIEDIQALGYAVGSVGMEISDAGDMIKDLNERIGELKEDGAGELLPFLEQVATKLGLVSIKQLETTDSIKLAAQQVFGDKAGLEALRFYVQSLEKAGLNQEAYTRYLEGAVSESTAWLDLLKDGGAELDRLMETAKQSGSLFTEEDLANAEKLREATADLRLQFQGLGLDMFDGVFATGVSKLGGVVENFRLGLHDLQYRLGTEDERFHSLLYTRSGTSPDALKSAQSNPVNITIDGQTYSDIGNNPDAAKSLEARMNQKASVRPTSMPRTFR